MKKFLRFLIVLLVVVAAAVIILGLVEPTDIVVSRSTMIKAPKEAVFEQMVMFKNWTNWSPWYKMDPNSKMTYAGTDGQPGSSYHWVGTEEKKTGEGTMKNLSVEGTKMNFQVDFDKPRKSTATGALSATDTGGMTKATWSFAMHIPFPMNAMCVFMNMDKMLGPDFESGLANMKQYVESNPSVVAGSSDIEITEVNFGGALYEGFRKTVSMTDLGSFFGESFSELGKGMKAKINGAGTGIFYTWDTVNHNTDMMAAFPAYDSTAKVKGAVFTYIPSSKGYMAIQKGGYSNAMKYHTALGKYVAAHGKQRTLVLEEYIVSQHQEPDSNKWETKIFYLVK